MAEIKYLDLAGLKALYGVVDDKITAAKSELKGTVSDDYNTLGKIEGKIKEINGNVANSIEGKIQTAIDELKGEVSTGYDTLEGIEGKITEEVTRAKKAEKVNADAIAAMDLTDAAVEGEFVTTVSQSDGKVTIGRGKVAADKVTAVAVKAGTDTVAIDGTTADAQIKSLGKTLKTVQDNAAKYEVVEVATDLPANVRTRYQVVSYVGDSADAVKTPVGANIDIPKDGQLINVEPTANGQGIKFTYSAGDGLDDKTIEIDLGKAIFESEIGDGLQVDSTTGIISVKKDAASETFLTVGTDGVKLAGVKKAIDDAVAAKNVTAEGDDYITANADNNKVTVSADVQGLTVTTTAGADSTIAGVEKSLVDGKEIADKVAEFTNARIGEEIAKLDATVGEAAVAVNKHVAVQVVEANGKITAVNVNENDIASAGALEVEVTRAKDAENKALADAKTYTDGEFTKRTTIADYGITDAKIEGTVITLGKVTLTFKPYTAEEIKNAVNN